MKVSQSEATTSPDEATTVVAPGTHIVGRISGQEDMRVQGTIEGRIHLAATLFVEPEGIIAADVQAHDIVVAGTVVGNLTATGGIVLAASARVVGDLHAPRLVVASGAAFRGQISTEPAEAEELEAEAEAGRSRGEGRRWTQAQARPATQKAVQTLSNGVRLPPQRIPRRTEPVVIKPVRRLDESADYGDADDGEWSESVKRAKKVARPRLLARGKHKVDRI